MSGTGGLHRMTSPYVLHLQIYNFMVRNREKVLGNFWGTKSMPHLTCGGCYLLVVKHNFLHNIILKKKKKDEEEVNVVTL